MVAAGLQTDTVISGHFPLSLPFPLSLSLSVFLSFCLFSQLPFSQRFHYHESFMLIVCWFGASCVWKWNDYCWHVCACNWHVAQTRLDHASDIQVDYFMAHSARQRHRWRRWRQSRADFPLHRRFLRRPMADCRPVRWRPSINLN